MGGGAFLGVLTSISGSSSSVSLPLLPSVFRRVSESESSLMKLNEDAI